MQIPAIIQTLLKNLENNKKILSSHDTYTKMLFMLKQVLQCSHWLQLNQNSK